jgi:hypothetical protein
VLIRFGMALDGYVPRQPGATLGELTTGPNGLLDVLETRLGLRGERPSRVVRVVQYQQCLAAADDGSRFYSASFAVDPLAVADALLAWRDEWVAAGWDGRADAVDGKRLQDLAEVERAARETLGSGHADRLRAVEAQLGRRRTGIERVELLDTVDELPPVWRRLAAKLAAEHVPPAHWQGPVAGAGSDLAALQHALISGARPALRGDGSVLLLEADSDLTLARALADCFASDGGWTVPDASVVVGQAGSALDLGLRAAGLPVLGLADRSPWRPALQVLRLALSLLWDPLDPNRLLEFLTLPVSPLGDALRWRLARVVAEAPGIGGVAWREAVEELRSMAGRRVDEDVGAWLEVQRFDSLRGAPSEVLVEVCGRVGRWAAARAGREEAAAAEREAFRAAADEAATARDVVGRLQHSGMATLGRLQLERLLQEIVGLGSARADAFAECGALHAVDDPAATIEPAAVAVWFGFVAPPLPARSPWSPAEIAQLRSHGADLPATDAMLQVTARSWLRPVLAAQRQLVLARPRRVGGEATAPHPLWSRIVALADGHAVPTLDVDALLQGEASAADRLPLRLAGVAHRPLPRPRRWWRLRADAVLAPREAESFSSLSSFVHSPHRWVLQHEARILPGSLGRVIGGNLQKSTLLHHLFEELFADAGPGWRTADEATVTGWIAGRLPRLLAEEGANYLLPGARREAEALQAVGQRAAWALIEQLRAAGAASVGMEVTGQGSFCGGALVGKIDMLVTDRDGREAVVDLKWSGIKYRRDELRRNEQLQLAVYASLRREATSRWPSEAFFVLDDARLLAQSDRFFPHASVCAPPEASAGTAALWAAFETTWTWRRAQLDQGLIEINVEGTEPDEASVPREGALAVAAPRDAFDDYVRLTGWPEDA